MTYRAANGKPNISNDFLVQLEYYCMLKLVETSNEFLSVNYPLVLDVLKISYSERFLSL